MRKIYLIGTIHGHTPKEELEEVLKNLEPDQLFVELPEDGPEKFEENEDIRNEMMFAYTWGKKHDVPVVLFDEHQPLFKEGFSVESPEYKQLLEESDAIIDKYSWKDFNNEDINKKLDLPLSDKLFDEEKARAREEKLIQKIRETMMEEGNIVVVTGTAHLGPFKKAFPEAVIPLGNS